MPFIDYKNDKIAAFARHNNSPLHCVLSTFTFPRKATFIKEMTNVEYPHAFP
jgi:hypothetical protein